MKIVKYVLVIFSCLIGTSFASSDHCEKIVFQGGQSVVMRSALIKSINATMEAPKIQVFSVSIFPPHGSDFLEVASIVIEPFSSQSLNRKNICSSNKGKTSCSSYFETADLIVTVYFLHKKPESYETTIAKIHEYVKRNVLSCS